MSAKPERNSRAAYKYITPIQTRWDDNDVYGHVNNVTYYSYFDTIVNEYLINNGVLDIERGDVIGFVVDTGCQYFEPSAFPDRLEGGLRVTHLGNSSVRYELGIFKAGGEQAVAQGHFVHVYVDRENHRPTTLPDSLRKALGALT